VYAENSEILYNAEHLSADDELSTETIVGYIAVKFGMTTAQVFQAIEKECSK
jgi:hypothetical protein